jgi:hypothetical protein
VGRYSSTIVAPKVSESSQLIEHGTPAASSTW